MIMYPVKVIYIIISTLNNYKKTNEDNVLCTFQVISTALGNWISMFYVLSSTSSTTQKNNSRLIEILGSDIHFYKYKEQFIYIKKTILFFAYYWQFHMKTQLPNLSKT